MKVLVATEKPFAAVAVEGIKKEMAEAGNELLLLEKYTDKAQLLKAVEDVDAVIVRSDKVTPEVLDAAKELKIVVRAGAGYDNIDTTYAKKKGWWWKIHRVRILMPWLNLFSVCSFMPCVISTMVRLALN